MLYQVRVKPEVHPLPDKFTVSPEHAEPPVPEGVGGVQGNEHVGDVTPVVLVQPFKVEVIVISVPAGIFMIELPLTVPAVVLSVPFEVTLT